MIELHHLENSRSQRVVWLLEELGVDHEIVTYRRDPATLLAPASLRAVHPLGKSPVITDEGRGGRVIAESGRSSTTWWRTMTGTAGWPRPRAARPTSATASGCTMPRARRCRRW
jgi:hypothetical protein